MGLIESPGWPNNYTGKARCSWRIITDSGNRIVLQYKNFSLQQDGGCARARLVVHDGGEEDAKVLGTYCGHDGPKSIISHGNKLMVQFESEADAESRGFSLSYTTGKLESCCVIVHCLIVLLLMCSDYESVLKKEEIDRGGGEG